MKVLTLHACAERFAKIAAQRWAPTLVFLALAMIMECTRSWVVRETSNAIDTFLTGPDGALLVLLGCSAAALGTMIAAALPWVGWRLAIASIIITLALVAGAFWMVDLLRGEMHYQAVANGLILSDAAFTLRSFWTHSMAGLLFGAFCAAREREAEMLASARNAELERARTQRALLDSRLQVLQTQVDPVLLFDGLADVNRLYRLDISAAANRLDELIAYLRSALPKTRA